MSQLPFEDLPEKPISEGLISITHAFNAFWAEYPRKVKKPRALKAFIKAAKECAGFNEIMVGLARYKANKPDYCDWAHPSTWLNDGRWEDEYDAPVPKPSSYTHDQLQIIAAHVKRDWYKGEYDRDVLQRCVDAGLLTVERMEDVL